MALKHIFLEKFCLSGQLLSLSYLNDDAFLKSSKEFMDGKYVLRTCEIIR